MKRARETETQYIYSVTYTKFLDDYKARGSDWSSHEAPKLFSTRAKADAYVDRELMKRACEHVKECEGVERWAKYFEGKGKISHALIEEDLDEIIETIQEGEFVPQKFTWDVDCVPLDEDV